MRGKEEWGMKFREMLETSPLLSVCNSKCSLVAVVFTVNRKSREKDKCEQKHIENQS